MFSDLKILFITHSYHDFEKDQIELLSKYFQSVTVLVRYKPIAEISRFFPLKWARGHRFKEQVNMSGLPGNVNVIPVPLYYLPTRFFYSKLGEIHYRKAAAIIYKRKIGFDLVHAHFVNSAGYCGAKLARNARVPFVLTGHGEDIYDIPFRDEFWKKLTLDVLDSADALITVSRSNETCIRKMGYQKSCRIIPNGYLSSLFFPGDRMAFRKELGLPPERKIVVSAGFLGEIKGHSYLIDAMKILIDAGTELSCYIIGEGSLMKSLREKIKRYRLEEYVQLVGRVPHHRIRDWIVAGDLLAMPSLRESFGVVQAEAMACARPVVATRNGGSEELIVDNVNGFLCEPANAKSLAGSISAALSKSWDQEMIIQSVQKFRWENSVEEILNVYSGCLNVSKKSTE